MKSLILAGVMTLAVSVNTCCTVPKQDDVEPIKKEINTLVKQQGKQADSVMTEIKKTDSVIESKRCKKKDPNRPSRKQNIIKKIKSFIYY